MKRVAIYGRHSSDLSDERSSVDQINYCREFVTRQPDWKETHVFSDEAISGSSFNGRSGAEALLRAAQEREFDIILAEHPDRISRTVSDITWLYDRCAFLGIEIWGVNTGKLDTMSAGMHGIMAQAQREEIARKVHRGMKPKIAEGRHMGGKPYGYRAIIKRTYDIRDKGKLEIDLAESKIVIRIFNEYLAGKNPRDIAYSLNKEGVPSPRGGKWNASTINGQKSRGVGILHNPIYIGRVVWNKNQFRKVPGSAQRRVSRPRSQDEHASFVNEELRIVSDEVFHAVLARKEARSHFMPHQLRKAKRPLSGKLRCGCCGSGLVSMGKDKTGKTRIICSRHAESKSCHAPVQGYLEDVEKKVHEALRKTLGGPNDIAALQRYFREEARKAAGSRIEERAKLERRRVEVQREIEKATDLLLRSVGDEETLDQRSKALKAERAEIDAKLATMTDVPPETGPELHPAAIRRFWDSTDVLDPRIAQENPDLWERLVETFRFFIEDVTVTKLGGYRGGVAVTIRSPYQALNATPPDNLSREALAVGGRKSSGGGI